MTLRHGGGGRRDRVDVLLRNRVAAFHVPLDDRRVAVGGDLIAVRRIERRAEVLDRLERRDRGPDVGNRGAESTASDRERLALDEHELRLRVGLAEAGLLEDLVGAVCLADVLVLRADRLHRQLGGDAEGEDDEREPTEDCCLPVTRTPATHAGRDVVRVLQGGHLVPFGRGVKLATSLAATRPIRNAGCPSLLVRVTAPVPVGYWGSYWRR